MLPVWDFSQQTARANFIRSTECHKFPTYLWELQNNFKISQKNGQDDLKAIIMNWRKLRAMFELNLFPSMFCRKKRKNFLRIIEI